MRCVQIYLSTYRDQRKRCSMQKLKELGEKVKSWLQESEITKAAVEFARTYILVNVIIAN